MSLPRRMGRLARGLVLNLQEDERVRERLRVAGERRETLKKAFEAARKGATEEWRRAEERRAEERRAEGQNPAEGNGTGAGTDAGERRKTGDRLFGERASGWRRNATNFVPRKYPPSVLAAYDRLGLMPGASMDEVDKKRRDLVKKYHPDRFSDPDKRARAERVTAEINAAHDAIERHLSKR